MSQKTRSALSIDTVAAGATALAAQAAAASAATALNPLKKLETIAGFVLRLFRSREQSPTVASQRPVRIQYGSSKAASKKREVKKGGLNHG